MSHAPQPRLSGENGASTKPRVVHPPQPPDRGSDLDAPDPAKPPPEPQARAPARTAPHAPATRPTIEHPAPTRTHRTPPTSAPAGTSTAASSHERPDRRHTALSPALSSCPELDREFLASRKQRSSMTTSDLLEADLRLHQDTPPGYVAAPAPAARAAPASRHHRHITPEGTECLGLYPECGVSGVVRWRWPACGGGAGEHSGYEPLN